MYKQSNKSILFLFFVLLPHLLSAHSFGGDEFFYVVILAILCGLTGSILIVKNYTLKAINIGKLEKTLLAILTFSVCFIGFTFLIIALYFMVIIS